MVQLQPLLSSLETDTSKILSNMFPFSIVKVPFVPSVQLEVILNHVRTHPSGQAIRHKCVWCLRNCQGLENVSLQHSLEPGYPLKIGRAHV